ncbi:MAG: heme-binding beta-barrel domain-containing protein [Thiohalomonadales bacterium]
MSNDDIDYGPLTDLIGIWNGDKGKDVAPDPDGIENNPYYETITFSAIGDVTNAESQCLAAIHYRQVVTRQSDDKVFHDETGYWMWDAANNVIMQSLTIPRAVSVIAGGTHNGNKNADGATMLEVSAKIDDPNWTIIQSPFMAENARTTGFVHEITVANDKLSYSETTTVDIYGKVFEHTDQNTLLKQ